MGNSPILTVPIAAYAMTAGSVAGDTDESPTNELQTLSFNPNNNSLAISQGNNVDLTALKNDADFDPANEIQTISIDTTNNEISLSKGGGSFTLPSTPPIFSRPSVLQNMRFHLARPPRKSSAASPISGVRNIPHYLPIWVKPPHTVRKLWNIQ